jgi:hypothetical protein
VGWQTDWKALSVRITSLLDAGHFYAQMLGNVTSDAIAGAQVLNQGASGIFREIENIFLTKPAASLPPEVDICLMKFCNDYRHEFKATLTQPNRVIQKVHFFLTALRSLQSEIDYLLTDTEVVARNLVDRAFLHLQRAIIADPTVRRTWKKAFEDGETACEKLGAVHLLQHGIWAFKAYAAGERTDLVLSQPLQLTPQIEAASEALVLTEWKLLRKEGELATKADEALKQARLYGVGALAGFELATRRYLVIVSKDRLDEMPADRIDGNVMYQYKSIAVEPKYPSQR